MFFSHLSSHLSRTAFVTADTRCRSGGGWLGLLETGATDGPTPHRISSTVEENVGHAAGRVSHDHVFGKRFQWTIVAVKPRRQTGVVDVRHVVSLCGLRAIMVDDSEELVLSLTWSVLVFAVGRQDITRDFQVDGEIDVLQQLLTSAWRLVVDKSFEVKNENGGKLLK